MQTDIKNVIVFGKNSFVANGIDTVLLDAGFKFDLFTRGEEGRSKNIVFGKISELLKNSCFKAKYDVVINYVVLKDKDIFENIQFAHNLLEFCKQHHVSKFIQFSSIMVYAYGAKDVDETTSIEPSVNTSKKGYGEIKIAVDEYLNSVRNDYPFEIVLVRPGYVLDEIRSCPFVKQLPFGFNLIKGNKGSKQPIVKKESIHQALMKIIAIDKNMPVYHFFPNNNQTKYQFAKDKFGGIIIFMPEFIFKIIPRLLTKMGVFPKSLYSRFEGMYIKTIFSSKNTEDKLKIKFDL